MSSVAQAQRDKLKSMVIGCFFNLKPKYFEVVICSQDNEEVKAPPEVEVEEVDNQQNAKVDIWFCYKDKDKESKENECYDMRENKEGESHRCYPTMKSKQKRILGSYALSS